MQYRSKKTFNFDDEHSTKVTVLPSKRIQGKFGEGCGLLKSNRFVCEAKNTDKKINNVVTIMFVVDLRH